MSDESQHEKELGGKLLSSVSRSFYLTLKALPRELREPISLAYLLARTADTVADTVQVDTDTRLACLTQFEAWVMAEEATTEQALARVLDERFRPLQTDEAEAVLMQRFTEALAWLRTIKGSVLENIRAVLKTIIHGQKLDIQRFPSDGELRSLQTADELHDYTYLVAGCVGKFWTQLCFSELPDAFFDGTTRDQATAWGIRFGQGLQLVNILRDLGKDARLGRCYLPQEQWSAQGLGLAQVAADPLCLRPVWRQWLKPCEAHLQEGLRYVQSLRHGKLRYATALPLLLAARTVAQMKTASDEQLRSGVKISRLEVTALLAKTAMSNSAEGIGRLFTKLSMT